MKNLIALFVVCAFLGGCSAAGQKFSDAHVAVFGCDHPDVAHGCLPPGKRPEKVLRAEAPKECGPVYKSPCAPNCRRDGGLGAPEAPVSAPEAPVLVLPPKSLSALPPTGALPCPDGHCSK